MKETGINGCGIGFSSCYWRQPESAEVINFESSLYVKLNIMIAYFYFNEWDYLQHCLFCKICILHPSNKIYSIWKQNKTKRDKQAFYVKSAGEGINIYMYVQWLLKILFLLLFFYEDSFQRKRQRFAKESHREVRSILPINQNYFVAIFRPKWTISLNIAL